MRMDRNQMVITEAGTLGLVKCLMCHWQRSEKSHSTMTGFLSRTSFEMTGRECTRHFDRKGEICCI